ncbi:replication-relaxation family protein [Streptacidiphilus cavernicola]|uniref:Replication-relaxation family protein n=1 Tax=Streptacidiphilus cavernicola TaxID=3342716 RepID=A0ABV6W0X6_9ACTN
MELSERDINVLRLVGQFSQLSTPHLRNLVFFDRSHSVADVVLNRLTQLKYLARVGRRASGDQGGAGAWVYQLGRFGRALFEIQARPATHPSTHALMIADTFVALRVAEGAGVLRIRRWDVELPVPPVRADLFVAVDFPVQQRESKYFLEIDLGSESRAVILEKLAGYWQVASQSTEEYFPWVVFVARNQALANQLKGYIRHAPAEQQEMTRVFMLGELIQQLTRL